MEIQNVTNFAHNEEATNTLLALASNKSFEPTLVEMLLMLMSAGEFSSSLDDIKTPEGEIGIPHCFAFEDLDRGIAG